jgi:hypothetical protein
MATPHSMKVMETISDAPSSGRKQALGRFTLFQSKGCAQNKGSAQVHLSGENR